MGKHAAPDGASAHPLVAAALASRSHAGEPASDGDENGAAPRGNESEVGWPAPPAPGGGGIGWPADADRPTSRAAASGSVLRRGWRRLFGAGRVA